jgi:membrane-bound ClpP family serine protease
MYLQGGKKLPTGFGGLQTGILAILLVVFVLSATCLADTFTNRQTDEVLHGFATLLVKDNKAVVRTQEKGLIEFNLVDWSVVPDRIGRNNKVVVLTLEGPIMYEIETAAFERAIEQAVHEGPLFILLQIDTPGGRCDYAQRICSAISNTANCQVVAYVKGGQFGGAISAGVAVALACNKIYMASDTIIGAAATVTISKSGQPQALADIYGKDVAEKFNSAWRAYLASLAEKNHRPGLLAKAMVDKDTEVVEVISSYSRNFIDPANRQSDQQVVRIWNKEGSLLTLTAREAVECGIADKLADSTQEVLRDLDAASAKVRFDDTVEEAGIELKRANGQLNRILKSIDLKIKQAREPMPDPKALSILRAARSEFATLVKLAKKYPDLQLNVKALEEELNSIEANYQKVRVDSNGRQNSRD